MEEHTRDEQWHATIAVFEAAVNALPQHEVGSIGTDYQPHSYVLRSGDKITYFDLGHNNGISGVTARTWDKQTDEITELRIFPGDVEEPVDEVEVLVNADRQGYSGYTRQNEQTESPNAERFLSYHDVVVVTRTVPEDQFRGTVVEDLFIMLKAPSIVRDLAPRRVSFFDPRLQAEDQAMVVEVLQPVRRQSLIDRAAGAWRSLVDKALGNS